MFFGGWFYFTFSGIASHTFTVEPFSFHKPRAGFPAVARLVGQLAMMDRCTTARKIDFWTKTKKRLEPVGTVVQNFLATKTG